MVSCCDNTSLINTFVVCVPNSPTILVSMDLPLCMKIINSKIGLTKVNEVSVRK